MTLKPIEASLFNQLPEDIKLPLRQSGVVPVLDSMIDLWNLPKGTNTVILISGRGTGKTWGCSDFIANKSAVESKRCVILRDEKSRIKASILNEILERFDAIPFKTNVERMQTGIKSKDGKDLVFTMGFKASDNSKTANMKGISDIDIAVVEEAEDITDPDKFNSFVDSLRKEGCLVIVILNVPDVGHFILKTYFDVTENIEVPNGANPKDYEGYFKIKPKNIPGVVCIMPTLEGNINNLPKHVVERYNAYGDKNSHLYNLHHYLTDIKGYASTGRKGQILKKVKPISLADYLALPFKELFGQDFGTAAPAGLCGVKIDGNNCYFRELNYEPMGTLEIGKMYCRLNFGPNDRIIADHADGEWKTLRKGFKPENLSPEDKKAYPKLLTGFNVSPCIKLGVKHGIDLLETYNLFCVTESTNFWEEIRNRVYDQDKNGNYTNDPEPGNDHLQDGLIYVIEDHNKKKFSITTG
jgi:phage terminase large subunit